MAGAPRIYRAQLNFARGGGGFGPTFIDLIASNASSGVEIGSQVTVCLYRTSQPLIRSNNPVSEPMRPPTHGSKS